MRLSSFGVANFALVLGLLVALGGVQLVALVAAEAEMGASARTLALLLALNRLIHSRRHVPSFLGLQLKLRLQ
jgi:hypothetical protein